MKWQNKVTIWCGRLSILMFMAVGAYIFVIYSESTKPYDERTYYTVLAITLLALSVWMAGEQDKIEKKLKEKYLQKKVEVEK